MSTENAPRGSGPDRIREAIKRDRGGDAPQVPINVCGPDCRGEITSQHSTFKPLADMDDPPHRRDSWAEWLICPGCLGFRFGPAHLSRKLLGVRCDGE